LKTQFITNTPMGFVKRWMSYAKDFGVTDRHQLPHFITGTSQSMDVIPVIMENRFITAERPFFNVYPKVADALAQTKLDIKPSSIPRSIVNDLPAISVKFAKGSSQAIATGCEWFLVSVFDGDTFELLKATRLNQLFNCDSPFMAVLAMNESSGGGRTGRLSTARLHQTFANSRYITDHATGLSEIWQSQTNTLCKIALGVMMLASDPDYIKPVVLKSDEGKSTTLDDRIARAKRRGVFGFSIGEDVERSPHFRRPHFAIRWTGKGASVPRLVPVKGAIIGKETMVTVPTGFEEST